MDREAPLSRDAFRLFRPMQARWNDVDLYGHLNNSVHYQLFDTVVNGWLTERALLDPARGSLIGLVVNSQCTYFAPLHFSDDIEAGLGIARIGTSSITYRIGLFNTSRTAAAQGVFTHVMVDRATRTPKPVPDHWRAALAELDSAGPADH